MTLAVNWDYVRDVLDLVRWLHVFAAIIWIGLTAFFWFMESTLIAPEPNSLSLEDGVEGERYYLHGGMFRFQKYGLGMKGLPTNVQWHPQWYAYGTWVTGFALLVIVYYWKADSYLIDPSVADIHAATAIVVSAGLLGVGWLFYDSLSRLLLERERLLVSILFVSIVGTAYALSHVFSSRGVVIEIGAILGTWMAGNVLFVWEPLHRALYADKAMHSGPIDPRLPALSWQRAKHNAYLAPPVLFAMLATHFSFVAGSNHAWIALIGFMIVGGLLRYFYIWRNRGRVMWPIPIGAAVLFVGLVIWLAPAETEVDSSTPRNPTGSANTTQIAEGKSVFASAGCASCHRLRDAGSTGTVGPDLDRAEPPRSLVIARVSTGQGAMPSFEGQLSVEQIEAVADYVSSMARR